MIDQQRAAFEAWLYLDQTKYEPDDLNKRELEIAQEAYQASLASPEVQALRLALKHCASVCAGEATSKSSLIRALELARDALAAMEIQK